MPQPGQDATFPLEARLTVPTDQAGVQELGRGLALVAPVAPIRQPDAAHAALAELRAQRVVAEGLTGERGLRRGRGPLQEALLLEVLVRFEQRRHVVRQ